MEATLVSIVTPVYNAEKFLSKTIKSVTNQNYSEFEYLLIDDCSTDNSSKIIKDFELEDKRIKYIRLDENSGAAVARNKGLELAKGQYIAFLDSDDEWDSEKLKLQISYMKENNFAFTYTNYRTIKENGEVIKDSIILPTKLDYTGLLKNTAIACSSVIIDRFVIGDFRMPLVRKGQDTATWLSILKKHDYAHLLGKTLSSYRQVNNSISSNKFGAVKRTWNTYRNIEKLSFPVALYYFTFYIYNAFKRKY